LLRKVRVKVRVRVRWGVDVVVDVG
jgi:hypothetical protein